MAARVGLAPAAYLPLLKGTRLLTLEEGKPIFGQADGFGTLYGSSRIADAFNIRNNVYKTPQDLSRAIDPTLVTTP